MPKRITTSYSRKTLFGGRKRITESHTVPEARDYQRTTTVIHLTGKDLEREEQRQREIEQAHRQAVEQARAVDEMHHIKAAGSPHPVARWLHSAVGTTTVGVIVAVTFILAMTFPDQLGSSFYLVMVGLFIADWHNMVTLHGVIHWRALRADSTLKFVGMLAVFSLLVILPVFPIVYALQAAIKHGEYAELRRQEQQRRIDALEQSLHQPVHD